MLTGFQTDFKQRQTIDSVCIFFNITIIVTTCVDNIGMYAYACLTRLHFFKKQQIFGRVFNVEKYLRHNLAAGSIELNEILCLDISRAGRG